MKLRHIWSVRRVSFLAAALSAAFVAGGAAGAAPQAAVSGLGAWTTAGSRVAFSGTVDRRSGCGCRRSGRPRRGS
jgi:hypothetical protein